MSDKYKNNNKSINNNDNVNNKFTSFILVNNAFLHNAWTRVWTQICMCRVIRCYWQMCLKAFSIRA